MKIYASSFRLCSEPARYVRLFRGARRVAVIPNALDFANGSAWREQWIHRDLDELRGLGLQPDLADLRDCFGGGRSLEDALGGYNGVWVLGGNVFILRRAMRQSGFDDFVRRKDRESEDFVYGGYSAGACVLGPTLRGLDLVDPPDQLAAGYTPDVCWEGLGIVPYSIAPHFRSDHPESERIEAVVQYFEANGMPYRALRDGESLVLE